MIGIKLISRLLLVVTIGALCSVVDTYAGDAESVSAHLTEQSFGLLNRLSSKDADHSNPLVGSVAVFAGDADGLRRALKSGDLPLAHSRMASLQRDASTIDRALNQYPNATVNTQWSAIRQQMLELADEIQTCSPGSSALPAFAEREGRGGEGCRIDTGTRKSGPAILNDVNAEGDSPRILIVSRESVGGFLRLKGYFEGTALKSAGLFEGSSRLKAFKVSRIPGRQRVDFDLRLEQPSPSTILRISDIEGRTAEAPVLDVDSALSRLPPPSEITPDSTPPIAPRDGGEPLPNSDDEDATTIEIPSHGPLLTSPSKRHTLVSRLGDVQIRILSIERTSDFQPTCEVIGLIVGRGITRAGIYLNGRLLQSIPIINGADYTSFQRRFVIRGGGSPVIRAYAAGNNFIEQPLDFAEAADTASLPSADSSFGSLPISANRPSIQITEIRPLVGDVYAVSGVISGPNIASAGLYQNGVLARNLALRSGLASAVRSFIGSSATSFNFTAQFNPYAGPASVRAFDSSGAYSEQPLIVGGISPYRNAWPDSSHLRPGNLPDNRGLTNRAHPSTLRSTRPLW
jgi:hypothetical protein